MRIAVLTVRIKRQVILKTRFSETQQIRDHVKSGLIKKNPAVQEKMQYGRNSAEFEEDDRA